MGEAKGAREGPEGELVVGEGVGVCEDDGEGAVAGVVEALEVLFDCVEIYRGRQLIAVRY